MTLAVHSLIDLEARLGAHNYKPLDVVLVRGEGVWVWDADGKRYLDCLSAYSALNQGHCHPRILAALVEQVGAPVEEQHPEDVFLELRGIHLASQDVRGFEEVAFELLQS